MKTKLAFAKTLNLIMAFSVLFAQSTSIVMADKKNEVKEPVEIVTETDTKPDVDEVTSVADDDIPEVKTESKDGALVADLDFAKDEKVRIVVGDECDVVESVVITPKNDIKGQIKITKANEDPSDTKLESAIGFCKFELENIDDADIEKYEWTLKLNRDEAADKEYDKDNMVMNILEDKEWKEIETKKANPDADNFRYEAETDSLSDGVVALAEQKTSSWFSTTNILICCGVLGGVLLLVLAIMAFMSQNRANNNPKTTNNAKKS